MNASIFMIGALSLAIAAPSVAATSRDPMGIAIGNLMTADYGNHGKVTAAFDKDGTVALTFPDGSKARQAWIADAGHFCMIAKPGADGKMGYRCERNMIAGKTIGKQWQQVDSEGQTATIIITPRP